MKTLSLRTRIGPIACAAVLASTAMLAPVMTAGTASASARS